MRPEQLSTWTATIGTFSNNTGAQIDICLTKAVFYVRLREGSEPIGMSDSRLVITYSNEGCHTSIYDSNGTICTVKGVTGMVTASLRPVNNSRWSLTSLR